MLLMSRANGWDRHRWCTGLCSQELQVNEEYVEKETEFDVNEEDEQPPVKCACITACDPGFVCLSSLCLPLSR